MDGICKVVLASVAFVVCLTGLNESAFPRDRDFISLPALLDIAFEQFDDLDVNGDGKVTKEETREIDPRYGTNLLACGRHFRMIDANGDGVIRKKELESALSRWFSNADDSENYGLSSNEMRGLKWVDCLLGAG